MFGCQLCRQTSFRSFYTKLKTPAFNILQRYLFNFYPSRASVYNTSQAKWLFSINSARNYTARVAESRNIYKHFARNIHAYKTSKNTWTCFTNNVLKDVQNVQPRLYAQGIRNINTWHYGVLHASLYRLGILRQVIGKRYMRSSNGGREEKNHKTVLLYLTSAAILVAGLSYAAVPLYRLYCQASGYGSAQQEIDFGNKIEHMERVEERILTIRFEAGTSKTLRWKFKPQQKEVKVAPGETALAFYTAENLTDDPIIGIATYNVIPFEAGQYFNKIQCFCFEEQQLNPNEEVDMPVFFYIDPDFTEDPKLAKYDELILSYTFFQSNEASAPISSPHAPN